MSISTISVTNLKFSDCITQFLLEKKAEGRSQNTLIFYSNQLRYFNNWLQENHITFIMEITPTMLRQYFDTLATHRNSGGVFASFRTIKCFLRFFEFEYEPENYKNPIYKVKLKPPRIEPIQGASLDDIQKMLDVCDNVRDKSILNFLASSGVRVVEIVNVNIGDIDLFTGKVKLRITKGMKPRIVFINKETRRLLRKYWKKRTNLKDNSPAFISQFKIRMQNSCITKIIEKYAKLANLKEIPSPHDFRRFYSLRTYEKTGDIYAVSRFLGHSNVNITKAYLAVSESSLQEKYVDPLD